MELCDYWACTYTKFDDAGKRNRPMADRFKYYSDLADRGSCCILVIQLHKSWHQRDMDWLSSSIHRHLCIRVFLLPLVVEEKANRSFNLELKRSIFLEKEDVPFVFYKKIKKS